MTTPQGPAKPSGRATPRRAQTRGNHGDVTGVQAANLRREHEAEIREAQKRMSTVAPTGEYEMPYAGNPEDDENDVIDYTDEAVAARREEEDRLAQQPELIRRGSMVIEKIPIARPRRFTRSVSATGEEDPMETVTVQFNDYYPEVTLGKDPVTGEIRTYDFEAGAKYKLPRWAAEHLQSKEMLV